MGNKDNKKIVHKRKKTIRLKNSARIMREAKKLVSKLTILDTNSTNDEPDRPMLQVLENVTPICISLVTQKRHLPPHNLGNNEGFPPATPARLTTVNLEPSSYKENVTVHDNSLQASSLVHVPIQGDDGDKENISPNIFSMNKSNDENECLLDTETEVQANSEYTVLSGRRIIDIQIFFDKLKAVADHKSLFNCGLSSIQIVSEHKIGLYSRLNLQCTVQCAKKNFTLIQQIKT